jgi:hypothetical protein
MTVTLNLPPEKEAAFKAQAQARGLSLEQWMLDVADQQVPPVPRDRRGNSMPGLISHDPNIPVLSDEAMSRESIYPDLT